MGPFTTLNDCCGDLKGPVLVLTSHDRKNARTATINAAPTNGFVMNMNPNKEKRMRNTALNTIISPMPMKKSCTTSFQTAIIQYRMFNIVWIGSITKL